MFVVKPMRNVEGIVLSSVFCTLVECREKISSQSCCFCYHFWRIFVCLLCLTPHTAPRQRSKTITQWKHVLYQRRTWKQNNNSWLEHFTLRDRHWCICNGNWDSLATFLKNAERSSSWYSLCLSDLFFLTSVIRLALQKITECPKWKYSGLLYKGCFPLQTVFTSFHKYPETSS